MYLVRLLSTELAGCSCLVSGIYTLFGYCVSGMCGLEFSSVFQVSAVCLNGGWRSSAYGYSKGASDTGVFFFYIR